MQLHQQRVKDGPWSKLEYQSGWNIRQDKLLGITVPSEHDISEFRMLQGELELLFLRTP
jgi:hypothetical protein